jgi:hypothetical protein
MRAKEAPEKILKITAVAAKKYDKMLAVVLHFNRIFTHCALCKVLTFETP